MLRTVKVGFAKHGQLYIGRTGRNEVTAVELNASPEERARAEKRLSFVKETMQEQHHTVVVIGVSAASRDWRDLPRMYQEASLATTSVVKEKPTEQGIDLDPVTSDTDMSGEPVMQHRLIRNIAGFLEEHLQDHVTVKQLAERFHLNASYLSVLFKKETGRTISDFVQDARMNRAKALLRDPGVKVYEVSNRVGFQTTAYFSYLFKKRTGVTPQEYRDYR